jgi:ATP/ADP translocase
MGRNRDHHESSTSTTTTSTITFDTPAVSYPIHEIQLSKTISSLNDDASTGDNDDADIDTLLLPIPRWSQSTSRVSKSIHYQYFHDLHKKAKQRWQRYQQQTNKIHLGNGNDTDEDDPTIDFFDNDQLLLLSSSSRVTNLSWLRPYWLGLGLFMILTAFWILDSLKDPILGHLVDGELESHLPRAKIFSVFTTIFLVCILEYISHESIRHQQQQLRPVQCSDDDSGNEVDSPVSVDRMSSWTPMMISDRSTKLNHDNDYFHSRNEAHNNTNQSSRDGVTGALFAHVGIPYSVFFGIMAYLLQFNPRIAYEFSDGAVTTPLVGSTTLTTTSSSAAPTESMNSVSTIATSSPLSSSLRAEPLPTSLWPVIGYFLYAAIESFGSLMVATFWSYTNSTLSLNEAERYYGVIVAVAQLGAITGSTIVRIRVWSDVTLVILSCLIIILHIVVMTMYNNYFRPSTIRNQNNIVHDGSDNINETMLDYDDIPQSQHSLRRMRSFDLSNNAWTNLASGLYLTLRYNYVLLICGVSCLYEISLTCLNYQMIILGWDAYSATVNDGGKSPYREGMRFEQFMGRYGQFVNMSSLVFSFLVFPYLIRHTGLRWTILVFPTLLLLANILAFGALPGNLTVLVVSVSLLKAMTYSIHDPAKELLYLPTSYAIKFKAKFWIDVVGARIAKAIGSSINTYAGSVDRSIHVASAPSLLSASLLWYICRKVGNEFDYLISTDTIIGSQDHWCDADQCDDERELGVVS